MRKPEPDIVQKTKRKPPRAAVQLPVQAAPPRRQRVQAAETGMVVLKGLAQLGGRASLSGLAAHIGESPAKVHRYLMSLSSEDLVAQDGVTQHYFLGPQAIQIGVAAMRQVDPLRLAGTALTRICDMLEVTCFVAVMGNKGPTIVRMQEPGLPVTVNVRVGSVMPLLWSATGRAFLAFLNDTGMRRMAADELATATPAARRGLAKVDPVGTLQAQVREQKAACVRDTYLPGISAVAVPIYNHTGRVIAVITALGPSGGFDPSSTSVVASTLRREARDISVLLGFEAAKN